jgi:hypothetical protein
MYGMVNRALEELITGEFGADSWESVKTAAGVEVDIFISGDGYPDEVTYSLVAAATRILGISAPELLRKFGVHWVTITARAHYADLLAAGGTSLPEFLVNLPQFHQRIGLLFPNLDPPEFRCSGVAEDSLRLHYFSQRKGLTHFVEGLILGLGVYFQAPVRVSIVAEKSAGADHDEFLISW